MAEVFAEFPHDPERFPQTMTQTNKGWTALRTAMVNTGRPALAIRAAGMPKIGDPHPDPDAPDLLRVVRIGAVNVIIPRDDGTGALGLSAVPIEYETPTISGVRVPKDVNEQWCEPINGTTQFQRYAPVDRVTIPSPFAFFQGTPEGLANPKIGINNGEGVSIETGTLQLRVSTFKHAGASLDVQRFLSLSRPPKINDDPELVFPPIYGDSTRIRVGKGQARYCQFDVSRNGDFLQITHTIELAENFNVIWFQKNGQGKPIPPAVVDTVYQSASFRGLWRE